eukprot:3874417-Karenia_brevis.AAC.1
MNIVLTELDAQPPGHRLIVGDLNADVQDIPSLTNALHENQYMDIGASTCFTAHPNTPTCYPPNHQQPT